MSYLEHTAEEWKNVNMLLQIETQTLLLLTRIHADGPADLHEQSNQGLHCLQIEILQYSD